MTAVDVLVLGGSGQIGRFLLPRLRAAGRDVLAVTRKATAQAGWLSADLGQQAIVDHAAAMVSAGPLDAFVAWLQRAQPDCGTIVAFSSTSARTKQNSPDPRERELALRLEQAEQRLSEWCGARNVALTVLRPSLIYGGGGDRHLSRIAALATRLGFFVLPRRAVGLRQPVHADDLAAAAVAALHGTAAGARRYDLPGGETLAYPVMIERVLASLPDQPRLWRVPDRVFDAGVFALRRFAPQRDPGRGVLDRLSDDLVFDPAPAAADLGYAPRRFVPLASMFAAADARAAS